MFIFEYECDFFSLHSGFFLQCIIQICLYTTTVFDNFDIKLKSDETKIPGPSFTKVRKIKRGRKRKRTRNLREF